MTATTITTTNPADAEIIAWLRKLAATTFNPAELLELVKGTAAEGTWLKDYEPGDFPWLCSDLLGVASARVAELLEQLDKKGISL